MKHLIPERGPQRVLAGTNFVYTATGQYLGVFGLGAGLSEALGPGLLIALCVTWGRPGWYVVGALFALTGLVVPFAVRWAERAQSVVAIAGRE